MASRARETMSDHESRALTLKQQVWHAMTWNTLLAPLKTVIEFAANLILLNVLTLPQVGMLRLITAGAGTLGVWVDLGIDRALPRFLPELAQRQGQAGVRDFLRRIFLIKAVLLVLLSIVALAFAGSFIDHLSSGVAQLPDRIDAESRQMVADDIEQLAPWLVATVLILVALGSIYDGLMASLVSFFRQRAWNLITITGDIVQPALAAVLVLGGYGVVGVLVALVVTPMISVTLAGWQVLRGLRTPQHDDMAPGEQPPSHEAHVPRLWQRFGIYTAVSHLLNLSDYFLSWLFAIFLLDNLAEVALFAVGTAMVRQALALLYRPLVGIQVPLFARVRGGDASLPETFSAIGRLLALILIPGGAGLMLLAHEMILVQYPHYVGAALVIYLLTPCLFLETFLSSSQIVLQVYERYGLLLWSRAVVLFVLPLMLWAAPTYGLVGAALTVGGGRVLMGLSAAILAHPHFELRYSWRFFGRVAMATLVMIGVVLTMKWLFPLDAIGMSITERLIAVVPLLGIIGMGAASFVIALRLLGGLEADDRAWIMSQRIPMKRWLVRVL